MFSAFYQVKYTIEHKQHATPKQWTIGILASVYAIWLVYAGFDYLLLTMLLIFQGLSFIQSFRKTTEDV